MRKSILYAGIPIIVLGAVILGYGLQLKGQSIIEAGQWQVTWYVMRDTYGTWGDTIDSGTFTTVFNVDPLPLAGTRQEPIGFKATLEMQVPSDMTVHFTIGGDDGAIQLSLDGHTAINLYCPDPNVSQSADSQLTAGRHTLELQYYQSLTEDDAAAQFDMSNPGEQGANSLATAGGALLFIGIILSLVGFVLKPKAHT